jgi:hypothetical protein
VKTARWGLLKGRTIAIDATTLEANAAMRSIVRRDSCTLELPDVLEHLLHATRPGRECVADETHAYRVPCNHSR